MRKHVGSDKEVAGELGDLEFEKIGSRIFPLRGTPASMPSVATRRSTRVFVRKNVTKVASDGDPAAKVLRSGKRLSLSKSVVNHNVGEEDGPSYDWMELFGSSAESEDEDLWRRKKAGYVLRKGTKEGQHRNSEGIAEEDVKLEKNLSLEDSSKEESKNSSHKGKFYGISYNRKRRRSHTDIQSGTKSFKAVWNLFFDSLGSLSSVPGENLRQDQLKKRRLSFSDEEIPSSPKLLDREFEITGAVRGYAEKFLIPQKYLWFGLTKPAALVLLLQSARISNLDRFSSLLVSILTGMMAGRASLYECSSFLSRRPALCLLSLNDIHLLPLKNWKPEFYRGISTYSSGFCILLRPQMLIPRVSVNFSALPFLFKSWHFSIVYHLRYNPRCSSRYDTEVSVEEQRLHDYHFRAKNVASDREISSSGISSSVDSDAVLRAPVSLASEESSSTAIRSLSRVNASKLRKRARKRSLLRNGRVPRSSLTKSRRSKFSNLSNGMLRVDSRVKVHPVLHSLESETLIEIGTEDPMSVNQKRRRSSSKNYVKKIKVSKTASSKSKPNVDELSCSANVLIIELDRCRRESGAKVTLELSSSKEWFLTVKLGDVTRFTHKAQEMKPCSSNRFTHALIWAGENGWKLEFLNKNDWNVFKELHKECLERNFQETPSRTVPIPGVLEVPGYEDGSSPPHFKLPDSYIRAGTDEIERVLMSEKAFYDMDSGDEEWLSKLNADADQSSTISPDDYERIITALEKYAYHHPDDISDQDKATAFISKLGNWSQIGDIHDHWIKKRRLKHLPLISVFQGQPSRKKQQQSTQKPHLRKKRSLKRQSSQSGRGNVDVFYEAAAKQEAVERFRSAESAVSKYVEAAVRLRSKAQELMVNADVAAYKAVMALQLAGEIREGSNSPDPSIPG